jgi:Putative  PD-(D/E)XK family member, (DUF4420)
MTLTMMIEEIWDSLRRTGAASQRRLDAQHPCDLYADFEPPDQVGLVAICDGRPILPRPMRAIAVEAGLRADGRWSLRLALQQPALAPVFAALCRDVAAATLSGTTAIDLAPTVLARLHRWRALLERDAAGLEESTLRGLIGELAILLSRIIPALGPRAAIEAWKGPLGAAQDFLLPDGARIEVKAVEWDATTARINGLAQLDTGRDPLTLAVVRLQSTSALADGAVTAALLVERTRAAIGGDSDALELFTSRLALVGWHDHPSHGEYAVRIVAVQAHAVVGAVPRLTVSSVPQGVTAVEYDTTLPLTGFQTWTCPE